MIFRFPFVRLGLRTVVGVGLLLTASATASAQDAPQPAAPPAAPQATPQAAAPQANSPWLKVCNTNPQTNAEVCVITQELRTETGQPIAVVTLQIGQEAGQYGFGIVVPTGFVIPPGIVLSVDGNKIGTAQYTICLPPVNNQAPVCLAQMAANDDLVTSMKNGNKLALTVVNPQNRQIPIELSLAGFTKAFEGPGIDRTAAEAQRKQLSDALQKSAEEARKKLIEQQQKELGKTPN